MSTEREAVLTASARLTGAGSIGTVSVALVLTVIAALVMSACGAAHSRSGSPAMASACQQVGAVLADGPDPGSDPVGYAEAQILPLRQLHASEPALRAVIGRLARAYATFFASNGKGAGTAGEVAAASAQLNKLWPGAAA